MAFQMRLPAGGEFGFIAAGGSAGALVGPLLTASLVTYLGPVNLLLISVLLLEAGPYYPTTAEMPDDLLNGNNNSYTKHDWHYQAEANTAGRTTAFPRGRVVGGSSAVNTAIALRGVPEDYDEWATLGNDEWSWNKVLPYFRRLENDLDFDDDFHGRSGPIPIRRYREDEADDAR